MDGSTIPAGVKYHRWLPYWAVLQTDLRQTTQNWVWRVWVLASLAAATLYLTHRFAVYREAKFVMTVDKVVANLLSWTALGTVTLVVAFCSGAIATERGTLADSVLCRGISRYQYFLAKLHSRLFAVLGTYLALTGSVIAIAAFAFPGMVTPTGCLAALAGLGFVLATVVCLGVTTSALCGSTVLSVSLLWIGLYTLGFALTFMPETYLTPDRMIAALPQMLRGLFNREELYRSIAYAVTASGVATVIGMVGFARADV